ncbi:MAG: hypothetical protein WCC60_06560 [Ilumatobacteraceae bacterium]
MNDRMPLDDDDLARLLAGALDALEPIPGVALDAAYAAIDMDLLSEELAALVFDSASEVELFAMRAPEAEARLLSFVNDHVSIDLELRAGGGAIVGQLSPPTDAQLLVEVEDGDTIEVVADEFGRFRATVPAGPVRLRLIGLVVTPWITR